jgi:hypothetical protein
MGTVDFVTDGLFFVGTVGAAAVCFHPKMDTADFVTVCFVNEEVW